MKIKLDENLDVRLAGLIERAGHDVETVRNQGLGGESDQRIFDVCRAEKRVLISQDLDFSNVLRFPPGSFHGLVVLRGRDQLLRTIRRLLRATLALMEREPVAGKLWIVDENRIRIYPADEKD